MAGRQVTPNLYFEFHFNGTFFPYVFVDNKNFDDRAHQKYGHFFRKLHSVQHLKYTSLDPVLWLLLTPTGWHLSC